MIRNKINFYIAWPYWSELIKKENTMILEVAILNVKQDRAEKFENDFQIASQYISSIEGYVKHSLKKWIEVENQYILLVEWVSVEAHEVGFRQSSQYQKWKALLHDYYNPFPQVLHYEDLKIEVW